MSIRPSLWRSARACAFVTLLWLISMPWPAHAQQSPRDPASLVFDDVTVIDVEQGVLVPRQRVVIVGNRIRFVGDAGTIKVPKNARVVKASGKYLIPGLWDVHTHSYQWADRYYPLYLANGVTGIRDAGSNVPLDTLRRWRRETLAGSRMGPPRQLLSGTVIIEQESCAEPRGELCVATGDAAAVRRLVDSLKAAGADVLKIEVFSDSTYFATADAAYRAGLPFGGHIFAPAIAMSDSGRRVGAIVDHTTLNGELQRRCLYGDDASVDRCRPLAERFQRTNTWWAPTWLQPPRLAGGSATRALYARFDEFNRLFWADSATGASLYAYLRGVGFEVHPTASSSPLYDLLKLSRPGGAQVPDTAGYLYVGRNAGLPIMAATDLVPGSRSAVPAGFGLHVELASYVFEGLTPLEALRTATLNPAKFLSATDSLGTVAPGKLADLVLLDADPLADITNTARIRAVVADGRYFDRAALNRLLADVRQQFGKK